MNIDLTHSFAFRAWVLCVFTTTGGFSSSLYAQHSCLDDQTLVLFQVSGNEDPAHIAALPALAELIASSDGGWQSQPLLLADAAARVNEVGQYAPAPVVKPEPRPTAIASTSGPIAVSATSTVTTPVEVTTTPVRPSTPTRPASAVNNVTPETTATPEAQNPETPPLVTPRPGGKTE